MHIPIDPPRWCSGVVTPANQELTARNVIAELDQVPQSLRSSKREVSGLPGTANQNVGYPVARCICITDQPVRAADGICGLASGLRVLLWP